MLLNNRYKIIRSLSFGGFGETFIAEDTQMPSGRHCVIKKLRPIANDPETYQFVKDRFQREAAILEDLGNHNHQIPALYAFFEDNHDFYLVQELIDGITLHDLVNQAIQKQTTFSEGYVQDFLLNFLPVLDYVHSKRIIHRDIKPDNIIIRHADQKPVLIDFGAVKEAMSTSLVTGNLVSTITIGTPGFMPSEQAAGRPVYSSDLYATGLTAIYLLTGKQPQSIETDYASGEVLWQQYAPRVNPDLAAILTKAIAPHARDRYGTSQEIIQALQEIAAFKVNQVLAPPLPTPPSYYDPTLVVSPRYVESEPVATPSKLGDLVKTLLIGVFLALGVVLGFWLTRQPQSSLQNTGQNSVTLTTPEPTPIPKAPSPVAPDPLVSVDPTPIVKEPSVPRVNEPDPIPDKVSTPPAPSEVLVPEQAEVVIQNLYGYVSNRDWQSARGQFTSELSAQLDPNFFKQFTKVTVENLEVTSKTDSSVAFIGTNTYYYSDGTRQVEERSYTVELVNQTPLISASEFSKVINAR